MIVSVTHISCPKISWRIKLNLILCLLILPLPIYIGHNVHVTGQIWFQVKDRLILNFLCLLGLKETKEIENQPRLNQDQSEVKFDL